MPELPEVEVTRQNIAPLLVGRIIASVRTTPQSYFFLTPPAKIKRALPKRQVLGLTRHGKYLLLDLDSGHRLLLHLGMTGQLFSTFARSPRLFNKNAASFPHPTKRDFAPDRHTHLRLSFTDGLPQVFFRDVRKFGKCALLPPGRSDPRLEKLGPDALTVRGRDLKRALAKRRIPIKSALLDQSVLAGVGNIYADEALFWAGLRPSRRASGLSTANCEKLAGSIRRVLTRAIQSGGSSLSDYVKPDGSDGTYQDQRRVYGRTKKPCYRCGSAIRRSVIGQRSTHYCPQCQR